MLFLPLNWGLRRIFGPERDEVVIESWRKLVNINLHNLY
jgi:hypothetical protein